MENKELYPELAAYIWDYCCRMTKEEQAAWQHNRAAERIAYGNRIGFHKYHNQEEDLSKDETVLKLLKNGYENFKISVITRIWNEHKNELQLNLCPKCKKIARTPWAEQCRFCLHSWREKFNKESASTSE
jgi:hypothetical protein